MFYNLFFQDRIGRCLESDVPLSNTAVSWKHCYLFAGEKGLWIEDLSTHGTVVEMRGQVLELERNLPTMLALDAVILLPCRNIVRHAQEVLKIETCVPTATVPTEEPPPAPASSEDRPVAAALQNIAKDIAGLRTACEGSWVHLHQQLTQQGESISAQQTETVKLNSSHALYTCIHVYYNYMGVWCCLFFQRMTHFRTELDALRQQVATQQAPNIYLFMANVHVHFGSPTLDGSNVSINNLKSLF